MSKYYDDLEPGQLYKHAVTRTVTEVDNLMFTVLSHNDQPLHLDEEFGKKTMYGSRICNSLFTLAFVNGATVSDLTLGTTLGNLGYEDVRFPNPVRIGDTLRSETHDLVEARERQASERRDRHIRTRWLQPAERGRGPRQTGRADVEAFRRDRLRPHMDFTIREDHRILGDAVDAMMRDFPDDYWMHKDRAHEFPWDFYNAFAKAGFLGVVIPEQYGGSGLGIAEAALVLSRVAGSGAALSGATAVHVSIFGMTPVVKFGTEAMRQKYLPPLVRAICTSASA